MECDPWKLARLGARIGAMTGDSSTPTRSQRGRVDPTWLIPGGALAGLVVNLIL